MESFIFCLCSSDSHSLGIFGSAPWFTEWAMTFNKCYTVTTIPYSIAVCGWKLANRCTDEKTTIFLTDRKKAFLGLKISLKGTQKMSQFIDFWKKQTDIFFSNWFKNATFFKNMTRIKVHWPEIEHRLEYRSRQYFRSKVLYNSARFSTNAVTLLTLSELVLVNYFITQSTINFSWEL